jgi:hypothetical protein
MKMSKNKYIGKEVAVGVPHLIERRPFFHYGKVIDIEERHIVIENKKGIHRIPLSDIVQLELRE